MTKQSAWLYLVPMLLWPASALAQVSDNTTEVTTDGAVSSQAPVGLEDTASEPFVVTGSVTLASQYRLRGISYSDEGLALQGGVMLNHDSGFYVGTWGSSLAGYGTYGGANTEVDLIGGYSASLGKTVLDGSVVWYFFPGTGGYQYTELYTSISHPVGPVQAKIGAAYAPKRKAIGNNDHLWVYGDVTLPINNTPISLKAHLGHTQGKGSVYAGPSGQYWDYSIGADVAWKGLIFNLSYVDTSIKAVAADNTYTVTGSKRGRDIVDGAFVLSLSAAF